MNNKLRQGFTVVEVMLFLAITGLLIAGILGSMATSLNRQRYRDGVEITREMIASQYSEVYSLTNDYKDDHEAETKQYQDPCTSRLIARGTSDCLYAGRLIEIVPASDSRTSRLKITPVIAEETTAAERRFGTREAAGSSGTDSSVATYIYKKYEDNPVLMEEDELGWGLSAVDKAASQRNASALRDSDMLRIALLIVRSPVDGTVTTYNLRDDPAYVPTEKDLTRFMKNTSGESRKSKVEFCLADRSGTIDPPDRMAIIIGKGAASPSDVETRLEDDNGDIVCK